MADSDNEFEQWMEQAGVRPLRESKSAHRQKVVAAQQQSDVEASREFEAAMEEFMAPCPERTPVASTPVDESVTDDTGTEELEFEHAMEALLSVQDKDHSVAPVISVHRRVTWEQLPKRGRVVVDDTLDLHGLTQEDALTALSQFIRDCSVAGLKTVCVITGKGVHSPDGRSVIRPLTESWLLGDGMGYVEKLAEASRYQGGSGALIVWLRPQKKPATAV